MTSFRGIRRFTKMISIAGLVATVAISAQAADTKAEPKAAAPDKISETYGAWTLTCGAKRQGCHISQALFRRKDKARILNVAVYRGAGKNKPLIFRTLAPLGLKLSAGVSVTIDKGKPAKIPFIACLRIGCIADVPLNDGLEKALRAGKAMQVDLTAFAQSRKIQMKLNLNGFSRALDRLNSI